MVEAYAGTSRRAPPSSRHTGWPSRCPARSHRAIAHSIHEGYEPWFGTLTTRNNGSLVADRSGVV
ncbi:hypothetical protein, partial [Kitasatospora cineracea]|uniref:hypothetical protein n=1 Tax=Kitasatospora cineracea TaxID=88074 RepID=UPI0033E20039